MDSSRRQLIISRYSREGAGFTTNNVFMIHIVNLLSKSNFVFTIIIIINPDIY